MVLAGQASRLEISSIVRSNDVNKCKQVNVESVDIMSSVMY